MPNYKPPSFSVVQKENDFMFIWLISWQIWLKQPENMICSSLLWLYKSYLTTTSKNICNNEWFLLWFEQGPSGACVFAPCACIWHLRYASFLTIWTTKSKARSGERHACFFLSPVFSNIFRNSWMTFLMNGFSFYPNMCWRYSQIRGENSIILHGTPSHLS